MQLSVNQSISFYHYIFVFSAVILLDRITKYMVLNFVDGYYRVTSILSFQPVLNRGIAGGIFNSINTTNFVLISLFVFFIYGLLLFYTVSQWKQKRSVLAETFILAGGLSNIIDRFIYNGVVDFILLSYKNWFWPVFNCADAFIVLGVLLMIGIDNS
jgi:signal peptidase II